MIDQNRPLLVADIGGTNARFALAYRSPAAAGVRLSGIQVYAAEDFETPRDAVDAYLEGQGQPAVRHGCFAVAGPVLGDEFAFTNSAWRFSARSLQSALGLERFMVVNDFQALTLGANFLGRGDCRQIKAGTAVDGRPVVVLGPGTGLGQGVLVPATPYPRILAAQGGHAAFAPVDETEDAILRFIRREHAIVTYERLLSGRGLVNIHRALCVLADKPRISLRPDEITEAAITGEYPVAKQAVEVFCAVLGTFAANAALMSAALGGVYLGGGILPRISDFLMASRFVERFCAAEQMRDYLTDIPVHLITSGETALLGAAHCLLEDLAEEGEAACESEIDAN